MKTVFVHDHVFKRDGKNYYSEGQLTNNTWQRYLNFSDSLTVMARYEFVEAGEVSKLNLSSQDKVMFCCFSKIGIKEDLFTNEISSKLNEVINEADVVVCRVPSFLGAKAFFAARQLNKKILLEVVGCPFDSLRTHGSVLGKILAPIEYYKLKRILAKSNYSIYVTKYFLQKRYPTNGVSINASNVELIEHGYKIDLNKDVKVIKFIGSLKAKYKGLKDLIYALNYLKSEYAMLELHVLGSGDKNEYENLINKLGVNVTFFDPIPEGRLIFKWLSEGDLYVQPSHTEGLPRALIEAMSVGLPCIGTDVGGIPELLHRDALCSKKSPKELTKVITRFLNDKSFRKKQSEINYIVASDYNYKLLAKRRGKFIEELYRT